MRTPDPGNGHDAIIEIGPRPEEEPSPARIEAFSDGVFAIIITLLVLDLRVPREATLHGNSLAAALLQQWPMYVAYVLSFLQVGVVWSNHHMMFHYIRRSDHVLLTLNLMLLLCVAVLPFTTAVLAEYARGGLSDLRIAAITYSSVLCAAGIFFSAIWQHALNAALVTHRADPHRLEALRLHWLLVPVLYGLAFVFALLDPRLSISIYILLLFYYALPGPMVVRWITDRGARTGKRRHRQDHHDKAGNGMRAVVVLPPEHEAQLGQRGDGAAETSPHSSWNPSASISES